MMTWEEIKAKYPHQYVGLVNVIPSVNSASVGAAEVKYTSADTSYGDLLLMYVKGEILLRYTTLDEDQLMGL